MPLFRSIAPDTLRTQIGERLYEVPAGKCVEIPDDLTYVIGRRGLPLEPVAFGAVKAEDVVPSRPLPAPVPRRVRGVVSGNAVHNTDVEEDRAGQLVADSPADGLVEGDAPVPAVPAKNTSRPTRAAG